MAALSTSALSAPAMHLLSGAYLIALMFSMGLELGGARESKAEKRHERRLLIRALLFNLAILPLVVVAVTRLLRTGGDVEIALVLLAASPGGRFAPELARAARADRGLSVEISLFLVKLVPFTAPLVARWILGGEKAEIHELYFIAALLVLQLVPYWLGKLVRRHRSLLADRLTRPVHVVSAICVAALLALVLLDRDLRWLWLFSARDWLSVLSCAAASLALGWLAGGPDPAARRSFAISANSRNAALALMLANLEVPGGSLPMTTFAVWIVFIAVDYGFVRWVRRRAPVERTPAGPTLQPSPR